VAIPCELEEYHVEAVTPGEDAQGQVRLRIRAGDHVFTGHGLATDVIEASARAYLAALSKVIQGDPTAMIAGPVSAVSRWT
jgi:2-isopropylmalate synthase